MTGEPFIRLLSDRCLKGPSQALCLMLFGGALQPPDGAEMRYLVPPGTELTDDRCLTCVRQVSDRYVELFLTRAFHSSHHMEQQSCQLALSQQTTGELVFNSCLTGVRQVSDRCVSGWSKNRGGLMR